MAYIFNSSFLRGLGIGLIISGLVFAISNTTLKVDQNVSAITPTVTQGATPSSQQQLPNQVNEKTQASPTKQQTPQQSVVQTQANPTTELPHQTAAPIPTVPKPPTTVNFIVPRGSDSTRIAELLVKAGLVQNKVKFLGVADNMKAARRFKAGNFTIPTGAGEVDIILILTK